MNLYLFSSQVDGKYIVFSGPIKISTITYLTINIAYWATCNCFLNLKWKILQEYTQNKAYDILMKQKVLEKAFSFASLFSPKKSFI